MRLVTRISSCISGTASTLQDSRGSSKPSQAAEHVNSMTGRSSKKGMIGSSQARKQNMAVIYHPSEAEQNSHNTWIQWNEDVASPASMLPRSIILEKISTLIPMRSFARHKKQSMASPAGCSIHDVILMISTHSGLIKGMDGSSMSRQLTRARAILEVSYCA